MKISCQRSSFCINRERTSKRFPNTNPVFTGLHIDIVFPTHHLFVFFNHRLSMAPRTRRSHTKGNANCARGPRNENEVVFESSTVTNQSCVVARSVAPNTQSQIQQQGGFGTAQCQLISDTFDQHMGNAPLHKSKPLMPASPPPQWCELTLRKKHEALVSLDQPSDDKANLL